jgi:hypothetical protein
MKLGDAFSMAVPPNYDNPHLFFVISDPTKHNGTFIIVNLTSDYFRAGKECVLNVGDHPRITKESYVSFTDAIEVTPELAQKLQKLIGGKITMRKSLAPEVLAKIVAAAKKSKAITVNLKKYL